MPTAHRASPRCNPQRSAQTADGVSSVDISLLQSIAFERLLADLSAGFINLAADKVDAAITDSLLRITVALGVDRAELVHFTPDPAGHRVTHSAVVPGVIEGAPNAFARRFPWVTRQILAGRHFAFGRLDELPAEANVDKASWQKFKVKSCVGVPIHVGGRIDSAIGVDCMRAERTWPPQLVERLQVLATIFGNALAHKRTSQELEAAIAFERMTTDIMGTLLQAPRAQQDTVLEAGLRQVAQAFGADRATLWQRVGDSADFTKSHRWTADSQVAALPVPAAGLSWVNAQLLRGSVVRFASRAELPAEAATDVPTLHTLGIGAAVIVPLEMSGRVAGALSIGTTREHVDWPDVLLPRAQLLGQAFASYIARQQAEQRQLQAQAQAAHAARVATLGVFAASLVHELTQPLAASLANAETARNLLARPAPALDEARDTVADIVTDSRRAGELIQKLRRFLRHGEAEHGAIEARGLMTEVLSFVASESAGKGISDHARRERSFAQLRRRPRADAAGAAEPAAQRLRRRGLATAGRAPRAVAGLPGRIRAGHRGRRQRPGHGRRHAGAPLPALLHHQARRHGTRAVDLPDHRVQPWRHPPREFQPGPGHALSHPAAAAPAPHRRPECAGCRTRAVRRLRLRRR